MTNGGIAKNERRRRRNNNSITSVVGIIWLLF